jgi:hypothetical protein
LFTSLFLAASDSRILSIKSISSKFSSHFQHGKIISIRSHLDLAAVLKCPEQEGSTNVFLNP